jgi:hypothetical protein
MLIQRKARLKPLKDNACVDGFSPKAIYDVKVAKRRQHNAERKQLKYMAEKKIARKKAKRYPRRKRTLKIKSLLLLLQPYLRPRIAEEKIRT